MKLEAEPSVANWMSCRVSAGRASNLLGKLHGQQWSQAVGHFLPPFFQWPEYKMLDLEKGSFKVTTAPRGLTRCQLFLPIDSVFWSFPC